MIKKIKKMKHGTVALACIIPVLYIVVLNTADIMFGIGPMSYRSQILKLLSGCVTAFFVYEFHAAARELPAKKNILISSIYLLVYAGLWIMYLLFPLSMFEAPLMCIFVPLRVPFVWDPSLIGAWMFIFVMEIVRSEKRR